MRLSDETIRDTIAKLRGDADIVQEMLGFPALAGRMHMLADVIVELKQDRDHWRYAAETNAMKLAKHEKALGSDL
jgi:hypothetical protein